jgi:hypothetical protein
VTRPGASPPTSSKLLDANKAPLSASVTRGRLLSSRSLPTVTLVLQQKTVPRIQIVVLALRLKLSLS